MFSLSFKLDNIFHGYRSVFLGSCSLIYNKQVFF